MDDLISRQAAIDAFGVVDDAFFMVAVIKARLKGLPSAQPELAQNLHNACTDLISRQEVIKLLDEAWVDGHEYQGWLHDEVNRLPSAQPEPLKITIDHAPTADELERIKQAMRITPVIVFPSAHPEPSEITDEQAIIHLQSTGWMQNHDREMYESGLRERLADDSDSYDALLPSAEPERKKGKWEMLQITINPPVYKCSVCGGHALQTVTGCLINRHLEANLTDFCPNCGADMRGEQNED